jgi:hypothetical protein
MDEVATTGLQSLSVGLTLAQRRNLQAIVEGRSEGLIAPVCESLVDVGLVRRSGDKFVATNAGCYIVRWF